MADCMKTNIALLAMTKKYAGCAPKERSHLMMKASRSGLAGLLKISPSKRKLLKETANSLPLLKQATNLLGSLALTERSSMEIPRPGKCWAGIRSKEKIFQIAFILKICPLPESSCH